MTIKDYKFNTIEDLDLFKSSVLAKFNSSELTGLDEAGRGALAADVVVACVLLPINHTIKGLKDSKLISPKKRTVLSDRIKTEVMFGIGTRDSNQVDSVGIYRATHEAAKDAVDNLLTKVNIDFLLTDGGLQLSSYFSFPVYSIIKGDKWVESISAASILAKVYHDELMLKYHDLWPMYGFDKHQGYGTLAHRQAILKYGPCPIHRKSFRLTK